MKKLILTLTILIATSSLGRAQSFDWAMTSQGSLVDEAKSVCMDAEGNSYVTGSFTSNPYRLGSFSLNNSSTNPSHPQNSDLFVAKFDKDGKVLWAMQSNGAGEEKGIDIACDRTGHIVVVGIFKGATPATFGATKLTNPVAGTFSVFIMRMNALGNINWVQRAGGKSATHVESVSTGPDGEIYITGSFVHGVTFGGYEYTGRSGNNSSVFVAKYLSNGELKWFEQIYGTRPGGQNSTQAGNAIFATSDSRFVYVAGWFRGRTTFGDDQIVSNSEPSPIGQHKNIFLTKYDSDGRGIWTRSIEVKQVNFSPEPEVTDIAADNDGGVYMLGHFPGILVFGEEEMKTVPSRGKTWNRDIFLAKYDSDGKHLWHVSAGGSDNDQAGALALTSDGFVITGAATGREVRFGSLSFSAGITNLFAAGYNRDAKGLWVTGATTVALSKGNAIAHSGQTTVIAGQYLGGGATFGKIRLKGSGSGNVFVAKLK
jgi:hypothetical protein